MAPLLPDRNRAGVRPGFVLPLALFMLLVTVALAGVLLDGAVQELRFARGEVAAAKAKAAAGSALADALAARPDSALLLRPRGSTTVSATAAGAETTGVATQSLGNGMLRVSANSRVWSGGVRADAAEADFVRIVPDSAAPAGILKYRRLPGWWWTRLP